jgi:hypothetical protein
MGDDSMETQDLRQKRDQTILDNPNQFVGYANITGILISSDDVVFHFGLRKTENPVEGAGIAKIYLGLPHAKRLCNALSKSLQKYEELFGEIIEDPGARLSPEKIKKEGVE